MKVVFLMVALALVGCGKEDEDTAHLVTAEATLTDNSGVHLNLTSAVPGCEWEVETAAMNMTDKAFEAGGHELLHRYNTKDGPVYSIQEGRVTRWASVAADGTITIGIQCL
jgi:hypothetical protein